MEYRDVEMALSFLRDNALDESALLQDRQYMIQMYPPKARMLMVLVEDKCDKLEYGNSPMFAEFVDREFISSMVDEICSEVGACEDMRDEILIMLCDEIFIRRIRYKKRRKFF